MITLGIYNEKNEIRQGIVEEREIDLLDSGNNQAIVAAHSFEYSNGDYIKVTTGSAGQYLVVQLDETLAPNIIYLEGTEWIYEVPLADNLVKSAVDTAFTSKRHHLSVRKAHDFEISQYQNLAINTHDQKDESGAYPHAFANVETRDDSIFFAKNAINGKTANISHNAYPFHSWGINQQDDAELTVDFGREVELDKIGVVLRGDYPHDSYWTQISVVFSNGEKLTFQTTNSLEPQYFEIDPKITTSITLTDLIKADDPSPFPALTEIEAFGKNL